MARTVVTTSNRGEAIAMAVNETGMRDGAEVAVEPAAVQLPPSPPSPDADALLRRMDDADARTREGPLGATRSAEASEPAMSIGSDDDDPDANPTGWLPVPLACGQQCVMCGAPCKELTAHRGNTHAATRRAHTRC